MLKHYFLILAFSTTLQLVAAQEPPEPEYEVGSVVWWALVATCFAILFISAILSGILSGFNELTIMSVKTLKHSGTESEKKQASWILPLVKRQSFVSVTLLFSTVVAALASPVVLIELGLPGWLAIIIICPIMIIFGQILPSGLCVKYGVPLCYYFLPLIWLLLIVFGLATWPLSKILDCLIVSDNQSFFRRNELDELIQQHGDDKPVHKGRRNPSDVPLTQDEVRIIRGALEMRTKTCNHSVYTPLDTVFALDWETVLDSDTRAQIIEQGHSRIPVYRKTKQNLLGIVLAKNLLSLDSTTSLRDIELLQAPHVTTDTPLYTLLNQFMLGRSHMAIVLSKEDNTTILGVVTLEDVMEELLQSEIYDEKDLQIRSRPEIFGDDHLFEAKDSRCHNYRLTRHLSNKGWPERENTISKNSIREKALSKRNFLFPLWIF